MTNKESLARPLGSLVTISGPLLSYPTFSKLCETPVLVFRRPGELKNGALNAFRKGFSRVKDVERAGEGMLRASSREEWQPILEFWSECSDDVLQTVCMKSRQGYRVKNEQFSYCNTHKPGGRSHYLQTSSNGHIVHSKLMAKASHESETNAIPSTYVGES
jgi:hypothetical protein